MIKGQKCPFSLFLNVPAEDTAPFVPLGGDDVAVFVESDAVRGGGDAFAPSFWIDVVGVEFFRVIVWAQYFDDFAFFIEYGDAAGELGDGDKIAMKINGARFRNFFSIYADECAIEIEMNEAVVGTVANENADRVEPIVEGEFMSGFQIVWLGFACGGGFEFSFFVENEDAVGCVAID